MKQIAYSLTAAVLLLAGVPAGASLPADAETSYGYLRTVEGPGRVVQASSGARIDVEANYPVLAGDLLEVDPGGRLELSLPDFNVVRLAGGSELLLDRLALSAETEDDDTALRLLRGELQFLVQDLLPVGASPRVDTANATIYLHSSGAYRIATDGYGWTEVVVRRGFAEVATEAGSSIVRADEQAWVEGGRWPRVDVERAGGLDDLERWGADLDGELAGYGAAPIEDHLAYSAAPLSRHGSWVYEDGYRAWRPAVAASWRPYEAGYWVDSPTGMIWVSDEPWGWVTYHYGSWVPSPSYGWVWRPGYRFAPAWVYWYWGPSYVAWVPVGYYSSYYGHYGRGFRFGIHGWAGGDWGFFADWTFCSTRSYRRHDLRHHVRRGHHLARHTRSHALERGLITTDSRHESRLRASRRGAVRPGEEHLPDVTAFVARRRELSPEVSGRVFSTRRAASRDDVFDRPRRVDPARAGVRAALPRGGTPETIDTWRQESGRLRGTPSGPERAAAPRGRTVAPSERGTDRASWWRDRPGSAVPRGGDTRPGARGDDRSSVMRRVWEGIRDRQRALPSAPRTSPGAPVPRRPTTDRPAEPSRRSPAVQPRSAPPRAPSAAPRSAPSRPAPSTQPRSEPPRRTPSVQPRSAPSRPAPSTQPRSAPSRRQPSAERRSSPSRSQPSASAPSRGSSRGSAASSGSRSSGNRSSQGSSPRRSARRRPPA